MATFSPISFTIKPESMPGEGVFLACYRGSGNFLDKIIRYITKSQHSHCEIVVNKDHWYTSSRLHGGVVRWHREITEDWDFIPLLSVTCEQVEDWYEQTAEHAYNWVGILGHCIRKPFAPRTRWHCAQWCAVLLGLACPVLQSPGSLYEQALSTWGKALQAVEHL